MVDNIDDWYGLNHHFISALNTVEAAVIEGRLDRDDGQRIKLSLSAIVDAADKGTQTVQNATDVCRETALKYTERAEHAPDR